MNKEQTIHSFWSSFGLKAYDENSVPDDAQLPYITYDISTDDFGNFVGHNASIWYRSSGWGEVTAKAEQISEFITKGGRMIAFDGGAMWIQKASPWSQRMSDSSDEMIRRIVLSLTIEFLD